MEAFDWLPLLQQWSRDILASDHKYRQTLPDSVVSSGWLGYPGATEAQLQTAEQRLGTTLPPSYRSFLALTNGWRMTSPFIYQVRPVDQIEWLAASNPGLIHIWEFGANPLHPGPADPNGHEETYMRSTLEISEWGDSAVYLLNPRVLSAAGEWEAWFFANWAEGAVVYPSFWDLMLEEHQSFLDLTQPST